MTNLLAQAAVAPRWFGVGKRELRARWRSWLTLLAMTEDDNEGTFGLPPLTGSFLRLAPGLGEGSMRLSPHRPHPGRLAPGRRRSAVHPEKERSRPDRPWSQSVAANVTAHPLGSARIGDDPATSALTDTHELRGHPGIFVTDGAAVPASLTVNPSLTIAALAERAAPAITARAKEAGVPVGYGASPPRPVSSST